MALTVVLTSTKIEIELTLAVVVLPTPRFYDRQLWLRPSRRVWGFWGMPTGLFLRTTVCRWRVYWLASIFEHIGR